MGRLALHAMSATVSLEPTADFPGVELLALPSSPSPLTAQCSSCFAHLARQFQSQLATLGVTLASFQAFEEELAALPGRYAPLRGGGLWLAIVAHAHNGADHSAALAAYPTIHLGCRGPFACVGCVGLRDLGEGRGELKRMFVTPAYRGKGVGRLLLAAAAAGARERGYAALLLDTLGRLPHATRLYEQAGFQRTAAYCENPLPDAIFMRLALQQQEPAGGAAALQA